MAEVGLCKVQGGNTVVRKQEKMQVPFLGGVSFCVSNQGLISSLSDLAFIIFLHKKSPPLLTCLFCW